MVVVITKINLPLSDGTCFVLNVLALRIPLSLHLCKKEAENEWDTEGDSIEDGGKCGYDGDVYYLVMVNRFSPPPILSWIIKEHTHIENMKSTRRIKKQKNQSPLILSSR